MTLAVALILFGALMLYCGIKGKSLTAALTGRVESKPDASIVEGSG